MEILDVEASDDKDIGHVDVSRSSIVQSKRMKYFIKRKISLSPMEIILAIPCALKTLESLTKLVRKKHDEGLKILNFTEVEGLHVVQKININKNHCNKTLHFLVEGLVDIGASMLVMSIIVVYELNIMHLFFSSKFYKTTFGVVTQAFSKINELL